MPVIPGYSLTAIGIENPETFNQLYKPLFLQRNPELHNSTHPSELTATAMEIVYKAVTGKGNAVTIPLPIVYGTIED